MITLGGAALLPTLMPNARFVVRGVLLSLDSRILALIACIDEALISYFALGSSLAVLRRGRVSGGAGNRGILDPRGSSEGGVGRSIPLGRGGGSDGDRASWTSSRLTGGGAGGAVPGAATVMGGSGSITTGAFAGSA